MTLTAADLELHQRLGIEVELLLRHQVRRVDDGDARRLLNLNGQSGDFSGIEYRPPYHVPASRSSSRSSIWPTAARVLAVIRGDELTRPKLQAATGADGGYDPRPSTKSSRDERQTGLPWDGPFFRRAGLR
jgi:hypothetical protein